jgi:hypothetical protein
VDVAGVTAKNEHRRIVNDGAVMISVKSEIVRSNILCGNNVATIFMSQKSMSNLVKKEQCRNADLCRKDD